MITARVPLVKFTPWPKTDRPWAKLHIVFAGPMKGQYHLIVVDIFLKWPKVIKCKNPMCSAIIKFLNEIFARFGIPDMIVSLYASLKFLFNIYIF